MLINLFTAVIARQHLSLLLKILFMGWFVVCIVCLSVFSKQFLNLLTRVDRELEVSKLIHFYKFLENWQTSRGERSSQFPDWGKGCSLVSRILQY